jgi:hypothetical protein
VIASGGAAGRKMMQVTGAATTMAPITTTTGAGATEGAQTSVPAGGTAVSPAPMPLAVAGA